MIKFILGLFGYRLVKTTTYKAIGRMFVYSFEDIDYKYLGLTNMERKILSYREFAELVKIAKDR
jgi:Fe-S-cluster formation regulator IscX/YfhJ